MAQDPDDLVRGVTRRISEIRKASGISQAEAARRLRTALQNWRRIEAGQNVTLHTLARIANVLGVEVVEFFRPSEPSRPRRVKRP